MTSHDANLAVVACSLGKRYGRRWVLRGVSFQLAPGTLLGLVGANGGGKTTTLRLLAGLLHPDEGGGSAFGNDIRRPSAASRRQIGYMSQRLSLYPELTVAENLSFRADVLGVPDTQSVIAATVERYGLDPILSVRVDRLSGGWGRRAQFAAVMINRPKLLLLDEPTAGLDVATRRAIWQWLAELADEGHIVIVSSHDLAEAELCPLILHYAGGRTEGPLPPAALIKAAGRTSLEDAVRYLADGAGA